MSGRLLFSVVVLFRVVIGDKSKIRTSVNGTSALNDAHCPPCVRVYRKPEKEVRNKLITAQQCSDYRHKTEGE